MESKTRGFEFRLLGPLEVRADGHLVAIGSPKLRALLAALLLNAGRTVPVTELVDVIWAGEHPDNPRRAVQLAVTRLRSLLGGAGPGQVIVTGTDGYRIDVDPDLFDLDRFRAWLEEAERAGEKDDPDAESIALAHALAEWRGEPLAGVASDLLQREAVPPLQEHRMRTVERRIDVDLHRGRHTELIGELLALTAREPVRERLWGQLMTALYRAGRRTDALAAYQTLRRHLGEELGVDPADELQSLHAAILAGHQRADHDSAVPLPPVPRQLPPDVPGFTGRAVEVARLDALLADGPDRPGPDATDAPPPVVITAIAGTAGIGKTALAAHWARRVADRFPDGQLWANLRGYHPGQAVTAGQTLARFLRALGVPGRQIPVGLDEQTSLFRSVLDGRRMLVVLDNANSAEQVRSLLPGAPGCLVVVTSRDRLYGLVAGEGAHLLTLDLLGDDDARLLLARRLGADRVDAEPAAVGQIIGRCARLPLALAIVAARAAAHPGSRLDAFAAELADVRGRLQALATGDPASDVRTVCSWSYRALSAGAARLFRLLGVHPGPDISAAAAASLAGLPLAGARSRLAELCRAHLLAEPSPGRYACHDLLRAYATELARTDDSAADRHEAVHRMLDHYLHTAYAAARLLNPHRDPVDPAPARPGVTPERPGDHGQALAWLTTEQPILLDLVAQAAATGFDTHAWQLAWALADVLDRQGQWRERIAALRVALDATGRLGARAAQARVHRDLGRTHTGLGSHDEARAHLTDALRLYAAVGDATGQAHTHVNLVFLCERQGHHADALDHARQALGLYRASGHRVGQANALNAVGWSHSLLGQHRQALAVCREAVDLLQELGDRRGQADAWDSLGQAYRNLGEHGPAADCYRRARDLYHELGNRYYEADALDHLGDVHEAAGESDAAHDAWRRALTILTGLDHPDAGAVSAKLGAG